MDQRMLDTLAIKEVVENWAVFRDSGDWERFRTVWHEDGIMMATWFQGTFEEFIRVNQEGWNKGVSILHLLGGTSVEIAGTRAIAQTKMTISQRAPVHGVLVDVLCTGRFYDFFEKRKDRWAIVLRRLFYEKDRMDPVDPSKTVQLDPKILAQFPEGYRHLAYLQSGLGFKVKSGHAGAEGSRRRRAVRSGKEMAGGWSALKTAGQFTNNGGRLKLSATFPTRLIESLRRNLLFAFREGYRRAIRPRKGFKRRHGSRAIAGCHFLNVKQTDSYTELPEGQLLDPHHLTQVLQIETPECRNNMQLNPWLVGIPIRDEVEPAAAEIPHAANFLEISVS